MKLLFKNSKKIFISILLFAMLLTSSIGFVVSNSKIDINEVYATDTTYNFNTNYDSSSGYPYKVSNFTISDSSTNAKHGVININSTTYANNYEKYGLEKDDKNIKKYQDSDDSYVLMINSNDQARSLGYTSSSLTFEKGGHYRVSINVLTDNVTASSSLYLFNDNDVFAKFTGINTQGNWQTYYFYFSTNDYEDLSLKIGLWQGSKEYPVKSYVLFDSVKTKEISKSDINYALSDSGVNGKNVLTNTNSNIFYRDLSGDNVLVSYSMDEEPFKTGEGSSSQAVYSLLNGEKVFKIKNDVASNNAYESEEFEMLPNKVYKFSIKARVEDIVSGSAYIKLVEVVEDGKTGTDSSVLTFTSTTNSYDNNFKEFSIIANSDSLKERTVKLVIGLGSSSSSQAEGEVYFKDYTISSVPYVAYSSADSSVAKTVNYTDEGTTNTIPNYRFDLTEAQEISNLNEIKINAPTDWTIVKSGNIGQTAGVFNIKYFDLLNKNGLTSFANPGINEELYNSSNNVLMLHNEIADVLSAYSSSFTLSKNSYYNLTVYVKTAIVNGSDSVANINLIDQEKDDMVIGKIENISTNGEWKEYSILIKTGYENIDASLVLSLGSDDAYSKGYAYFDQCKLKDSTQAVFDDYNEGTTYSKRFDLTKPFTITDEKGTPVYFDGISENGYSSSVAKIVDLEDSEALKRYLEDAEINAIQSNDFDDQNALLISILTRDDYYKLSTKLNYSLTSGSMYVLSVDVFTAYLKTDDKEHEATATLSLSDIEDSSFTKVSTNADWTTYTFFITPDSSVTTQMNLGLGSADVQCRGVVLFSNINFQEITDEEEFERLKKNTENSLVVNEVVKDDKETKNEKDDNDDINWVLLSSTLTAVVLIIAVLAVGFKKIFKPGKKKVKKTKVEYDRTNSVMRQKYRKLAYLKRDKDIRIIEKKLALLNEDKLEKEAQYKELLSKVRQLKLANRDGKLDKELASLNKELNNSSKNVSKSGVQVNKLKSEIAYMRTEGYLLDLEKRLMKQDELAKAKGSSIEEILKAEDIDVSNVEIEKDNKLSNAISKADEIITEQERLEQERLENERLEQERLENERLEQERLEKELHEKEEAERLEREKLEASQTQEVETNEEKTDISEVKDDGLKSEETEVKTEEIKSEETEVKSEEVKSEETEVKSEEVKSEENSVFENGQVEGIENNSAEKTDQENSDNQQ